MDRLGTLPGTNRSHEQDTGAIGIAQAGESQLRSLNVVESENSIEPYGFWQAIAGRSGPGYQSAGTVIRRRRPVADEK